MKKFLAAAIAAFLLNAGQAEDLQKLFDDAAKSPDKTLRLSGVHAPDAPVRLSAMHDGLSVVGDGSAVISGERKIGNWRTEGGLWKAQVDVGFAEYLIVNGRRAKIAASREITVSKVPPNRDVGVLRVDNRDIPAYAESEKDGAFIEFTAFWTFKRYYIESVVDNGDGTSDIRLKNGDLWLVYLKPDFVHFRFANSKSFLTAGQFYFDAARKTLYYCPRAGETPENSSASVAGIDRLLEIDGARNITVQNVRFEHCAARSNYEHNDMQASSVLPAAIEISNAENVAFVGCEFEKINGFAIAVERAFKGGLVKDCVFSDIGGGAVRLGDSARDEGRLYGNVVRGVQIRNNIIYRYGREFLSAAAILILDCAENTVADNTVVDGFYTGISCGWSWSPTEVSYAGGNRILRNRITKIGQGKLSDLAGIYVLGTQEGTLVEGNRIEDVSSRSYGGNGIYCDESSHLYTVKNNTVINAQSGMHFNKVRAVRVFNNVVAGARRPITLEWMNQGKYREDLHKGAVIERNIFEWTDDSLKMAIALNRDLPVKKFDGNVYFRRGRSAEAPFEWAFGFGTGAAKFSDGGFEQWRKASGYDAHSLNENPQIVDGEPQNIELCEKIGFEFFSTKSAGVKGEMRGKLAKFGLE